MGKKIYVGNLSYTSTESSITELFSQHGEVSSCRLVIDRDTGRSKGFCFVEMSSGDDADKAIAALDGQQVDGRAIKVNEARPQAPRSGGYGSSSRDSYGSGGDTRFSGKRSGFRS